MENTLVKNTNSPLEIRIGFSSKSSDQPSIFIIVEANGEIVTGDQLCTENNRIVLYKNRIKQFITDPIDLTKV